MRPDRSALGSWADVADRLAPVFPRLKATPGLQDSFKHARFDVVVDLGASPLVDEVALLVHYRGPHPERSQGHPVWPVLYTACAATGSVLREALSDALVKIPGSARRGSLPSNQLDQVYEVAAEPAGPLDGIDDHDWSRWRHAYGDATDVPALLRALRSGDREVRNQAWVELYSNLYHERSVYEATVHAVPYLLALLGDPTTPDRRGLLRYLLDLSLGLPEDYEASRVPWAIAKGVPMLLSLAREDSSLRAPAIYLLATLPRTARQVRPLLDRIATEEADPIVRANAAYAVGMAWKTTLQDLQTLERTLESDDAGERFAAALAMHRADYVTPAVIDQFIDVLADPSPYREWAESCPWGEFDAGGAALDQILRLDRSARWATRHRLVGLLVSNRANPRWPHGQDIALDLLALAFAGRRERGKGEPLDSDQRFILAAIAACRSVWRGPETEYFRRRLEFLGLPADGSSLAELTREGSPSWRQQRFVKQ